MTQTNSWIVRSMPYIALYNALVSVVFIGIAMFAEFDLRYYEYYAYFQLDYIELSFLDSYLFRNHIGWLGDLYQYSEIFTPIFYVLLFAAAILAIRSNGREQRLLKFCMSITFMSMLLWMMNYISLLISLLIVLSGLEVPEMEDAPETNFLPLIFTLVKYIFMLVITYNYLKINKRRREFEKKEDASTLSSAVSKKTRLLHYLVDTILIILLFFPVVFSGFRSYLSTLEDMFGTYVGMYIIFSIAVIIYYFIFEGFFKSTPAKYLTSSAITSFNRQKPTTLQIISRTFSRRIPFEAFSFLGRIGWHDQFSKITVTRYTSNTKYHRWIVSFFIICFLLVLIVAFTNFFR